MARSDYPAPVEGFVATHFVVAEDIERTAHFYSHVLGGQVVFEAPGAPQFIKLANTWVIVNAGGGPTPDKPTVTLEPHPDPDRTSAFMNIRVADIAAIHAEWSERGAEFLTESLDNNGYELRCYLRDPDGRLIEVGQPTGMLDIFGLTDE
ncbi:MAG: VOC family protein [Acidimicrobiales bacterium]